MMKILIHVVLHMIVVDEISWTEQGSYSQYQVYPSEYAYRDDSVQRNERHSANCRRYPASALPGGFNLEQYVHCDGTQLQLADSNLGQEKYQIDDYYLWSTGKDGKLLFSFPIRVSLTTITLHYYSDSDRGLPRLRFSAVPDDFDIWDVPTADIPYVEIATVPPGGEPAGCRNVSINVTFATMKVLMYKYRSSSQFALSEVKFLKCEATSTSTSDMIDIPTLSVQTESDNATVFPETVQNFTTTLFAKAMSTKTSFISESEMLIVKSNSITVIIAIVVSIAILLILSITFIIIVVPIWRHKRQKVYTDRSSTTKITLSRRTGQQIQPQSIQHESSELYDQIHLSPSTGQTEFIEKTESENINNPIHNHPTQSNTEHFVTPSKASVPKINSQLAPQNDDEITSEQPTYAAIDKSKKKRPKKHRKTEDNKYSAAEKDPPISLHTEKVSDNVDKETCAIGKDDPTGISQKPLVNEDMYASVLKDTKKEKRKVNLPHMVEELYTAVKKKPKCSVLKDEEEIPPIPPHTVEEFYTAVMKMIKSEANLNIQETKEQPSPILQHTIEDLYTAVMKMPKDGSPDDTEAAPLIPPHTMEELYTAIQKEGTVLEDEEEAP